MKMLYAVFFVFACSVTINTIAQNLSTLLPCCDNGVAESRDINYWTHVMDVYNNCTDQPVTCRECVDRTRDQELCAGSAGSRFTEDGPARYYAVNHPFIVSTSSLSFTAQQGGSNPGPQTFSVSNGVWQRWQIDETLSWSATKTQNWLLVSPTSGNVTGNTPVSITVSANIDGLAAGTYQDDITISSTQVSSLQWETIHITLTITSSMSVSISGSTELLCNQTGTWTASASGGMTPYYYQWYYQIVCSGLLRNTTYVVRPLTPPCGYWISAGDHGTTFQNSYCSDFEVMCEVTDALSHSAESNVIYVTVGNLLKLAATPPNSGQPLVEHTNEKTIVMSEETFEQKFSSSQLFNQNYPNPFNPTTKIGFALPQKSQIKLKVFDVLGREIQILADGLYDAGKHEVEFNASNLSSGIYFYNLSDGTNSITKKMLLMK